MSPRKKDEVTAPFDYEQERAELFETMCNLHISRIDEMPRIELYLDQVLSIVSTELAPLYVLGEKVVTGSMVNNYVKQRIMPAPNRKRYTRRHLPYLMFVCCLKRILSISQIAQLIDLGKRCELDVSHTYDEFATALEGALAARFANGAPADDLPKSTHLCLRDVNGVRITGELPVLLERAIELLANRAYIDKMLDLEERRALTAALDSDARTAAENE